MHLTLPEKINLKSKTTQADFELVKKVKMPGLQITKHDLIYLVFPEQPYKNNLANARAMVIGHSSVFGVRSQVQYPIAPKAKAELSSFTALIDLRPPCKLSLECVNFRES